MQLDLLDSNKRLVSAKRTKNERSGLHGWHPYYAGYAEDFVKAAIEYFELKPNSLILDPWNGSGTTALVASKLDMTSIGFDINQAMNLFSLAKTGYVSSHASDIKKIASDIGNEFLEFEISVADDDPLLDFMSPSLCASVRSLYATIHQTKVVPVKFVRKLENAFSEKPQTAQPILAFLTTALFLTARKLAGYKGGSNPTWVKILDNKPVVKKATVAKTFLDQVTTMLHDLQRGGPPASSELRHLACFGNSRKMSLKDSVVDAIITSPPYLTRIDYAMSTRPELLILSDAEELRKTRELTMGAPVIVDKTLKAKSAWGKSCNRLLKSVAQHSSKSSVNYYLPNMLQYFRDAEESLSEIVRVLKPGARALVVVQSSYFKEHEIDLGNIYVEMSKQFSVSAEIVFRDIVRGHMAHVNTKSSHYKKDKVFYEDVVEIAKQ